MQKGAMNTQRQWTFYKQIGELVWHYREERQMSQAELAAEIGIPAISVAKLEKGTLVFPAHRILDLADALSLPLEKLLPEHEPSPAVAKRRNQVWGLESDEEAVAMIRSIRQWRKQKALLEAVSEE